MSYVKPMKVLFVKEGRDMYGAELATYRLLTSLDRERIDPSLCVLEYGSEPSQFLTQMCDVDVALTISYSADELGKQLKRLAGECDAVVSIGYKCHILCWWFCRKQSVKTYGICHGWVATDFKLKCYNSLARFCLKSFDGVMPVSPTIRVPNSNRRDIYNGVNRAELEEQASRGALAEGLSGRPLVAYVGRLEREKGVVELVRAAMAAQEEYQLLIVGDGSLGESLKGMILGHDAERRIHFRDHQENAMPIIKTADLLILPSFTEAVPLVVLEAMALGTPVLATAVGAIPEMIVDGESGFILSSNSPEDIRRGISRVLSDRAGCSGVVDAARRIVSDRFTDDRVAERVTGFLEAGRLDAST